MSCTLEDAPRLPPPERLHENLLVEEQFDLLAGILRRVPNWVVEPLLEALGVAVLVSPASV